MKAIVPAAKLRRSSIAGLSGCVGRRPYPGSWDHGAPNDERRPGRDGTGQTMDERVTAAWVENCPEEREIGRPGRRRTAMNISERLGANPKNPVHEYPHEKREKSDSCLQHCPHDGLDGEPNLFRCLRGSWCSPGARSVRSLLQMRTARCCLPWMPKSRSAPNLRRASGQDPTSVA
jgi:hypothetical protein